MMTSGHRRSLETMRIYNDSNNVVQPTYGQGSNKLGNQANASDSSFVHHDEKATFAAGCMSLRHRVVIYQHTTQHSNCFSLLVCRTRVDVDDLSRSRAHQEG